MAGKRLSKKVVRYIFVPMFNRSTLLLKLIMKTLFALAIGLFLFVGLNQARAQVLKQGTVLLNGGFGFPSGTTLINIDGEYGAADNIGVGALVKFVTASGGGTLLGLQGNYHLAEALKINNDKIDPYVGLSLNKATSSGSSVAVGGQLGLRYMFQEQFGLGAAYNLYFGDSYSGANHFAIFFTYKLGNN